MITLTESALAAVKSVCTDPGHGLRIMAVTGGCSGLQYRLGLETEPFDDDQVLEFDGIKVYVDPSSSQLLAGVTMDYVDSAMGAGFMFDNPNKTEKSCSCSSKSCG